MATHASPNATDPGLERNAWDLEPLLEGEGRDGVERRLAEALTRAQAFAERYAGKLGELDSEGLRQAMEELAAINELVGRAGTYAALRFATDTADPANGALLQLAQERGTAIETTLLFFELEWAALEQDRVDELLAPDELDFCRHHLHNVRRYRDHLLSEAEEKILAEKALTGASAWSRLFEELTSTIEVELPSAQGAAAGNGAQGEGAGPGAEAAGMGERADEEQADEAQGGGGGRGTRVALDVALSQLISPNRDLRQATAQAVTAAL